jgi:hypothetical protein
VERLLCLLSGGGAGRSEVRYDVLLTLATDTSLQLRKFFMLKLWKEIGTRRLVRKILQS